VYSGGGESGRPNYRGRCICWQLCLVALLLVQAAPAHPHSFASWVGWVCVLQTNLHTRPTCRVVKGEGIVAGQTGQDCCSSGVTLAPRLMPVFVQHALQLVMYAQCRAVSWKGCCPSKQA